MEQRLCEESNNIMSLPDTQETPHSDERETGRLEAFSDGVFAIAITLLVLNIQIPRDVGMDGLLAAIMKQGSSFLAYVVSFLTILVMWVNHHGMFTLIRRVDRAFLVINGLLLLFVCFVDYPTSLVAAFITGGNGRVAAIFLNLVYFVIAICYNVLWAYAARGQRLLDEHVDVQLIKQINAQYRFGPLLYIAAALLAFIAVPLSLGMNAAMAIYFGFTSRTERRAPHRQAATSLGQPEHPEF